MIWKQNGYKHGYTVYRLRWRVFLNSPKRSPQYHVNRVWGRPLQICWNVETLDASGCPEELKLLTTVCKWCLKMEDKWHKWEESTGRGWNWGEMKDEWQRYTQGRKEEAKELWVKRQRRLGKVERVMRPSRKSDRADKMREGEWWKKERKRKNNSNLMRGWMRGGKEKCWRAERLFFFLLVCFVPVLDTCQHIKSHLFWTHIQVVLYMDLCIYVYVWKNYLCDSWKSKWRDGHFHI